MTKLANLFLLITIVISVPAFGAEFYVDSVNGLDSNTGTTIDDPFKTITHSVSRIFPTAEDPVILHVIPGKYDLTLGEIFPIIMKSNLTVHGYTVGPEQNGNEITVDASTSGSSVFSCAGIKSVTFDNIIIAGGGSEVTKGGGINCYDSSNITIQNCTIKDNIGDSGGGVYLGDSIVLMSDSIFTGNRSAYGGNLSCYYSSPRISRCSFDNGWVEVTNAETGYGGNGGSIYLKSSSPYIIECSFTGSRAVNGGAIYCNQSSPSLMYTTFMQNYVESEQFERGNGGAITCGTNTSPIINGCNFIENYAINGGAIFCEYDSSPSIVDSYLGNNHTSGGGGGGICTNNASPDIENCYFSWNRSESNESGGGFGGGVCFNGATPKLNDCTFKHNQAYEGGGGVFLSGTVIDVKNSLFSNNYIQGASEQEGGYGGGIYIDSSPDLRIINCLINENQAERGGGIFCASSSFKINNTTIVANTGSYGKGIFVGNKFKPALLNSIVWNNYIFGDVDANYCDIQDGHDGEGNIDSDPLFIVGPNGGYYLRQTASSGSVQSPCVDAGTTWKIDIGFNPHQYTTRTDGIFDKDITDIGYHHRPHVEFALYVSPEDKPVFAKGDKVDLLFDITTAASASINCDVYFVMVDPLGSLYFASGWGTTPAAVASNMSLPMGVGLSYQPLFSLDIPNAMPTINMTGQYIFAIGVTKAWSPDFISNIASVSFNVQM